MTNFFEVFNPGAAHARAQKDLEKILVADYEKGAWGPKPHDLASGKVTIKMPTIKPKPRDSEAGSDG